MNECMYYGYCSAENTSECSEICIKRKETEFLMESAMIPERERRIKKLTVPEIDTEVYNKLNSVLANINRYVGDGYNLLLYSSNTGNGKTSWAIKLMLAYFDTIWAGNGFTERGYFLYVPEFLRRVKNSFSRPDDELDVIMSKIRDVDILVLDDVGTSEMSNYDVDLLIDIINQRYAKGKCTVFTTNCDELALKRTVGMRLADRIWNTSVRFGLKSRGMRSSKI